MPFVVHPQNLFIDAPNIPQTYTLSNPSPEERTMLLDLLSWGWAATQHDEHDEVYMSARAEIERAEKRRRRRTQMVFGDMVGENPRLTLSEVWEQEAERILRARAWAVDDRGRDRHEGRVREGDRGEGGDLDGDNTDDEVDRWYVSQVQHLKYIAEVINSHYRTLSRQEFAPKVKPKPDSRPNILAIIAEEDDLTCDQDTPTMDAYEFLAEMEAQIEPPSCLAHIRPSAPYEDFQSSSSPSDTPTIDAYEFLAQPEAQIPPPFYPTPNQPSAPSIDILLSSSPPETPSSPRPSSPTTPPLTFPGDPVTPRTYFSLIHHLAHHDLYPGHYAPPLCRPALGADAYGWLAWDEGRQRSEKRQKKEEKKENVWVQMVREGVMMGWMV